MYSADAPRPMALRDPPTGTSRYTSLKRRFTGCGRAGGGGRGDMDLIASEASSQTLFPGEERAGQSLLNYSRFATESCAGIGMLSQGVQVMPASGHAWFSFCFLPAPMGDVLM